MFCFALLAIDMSQLITQPTLTVSTSCLSLIGCLVGKLLFLRLHASLKGEVLSACYDAWQRLVVSPFFEKKTGKNKLEKSCGILKTSETGIAVFDDKSVTSCLTDIASLLRF
jgi:hypothetical protein